MNDDMMPPKAPPDPQFIRQPPFVKHRQQFDRSDYSAIFEGKAVLPNFEPMPVWQVAKMLISFYGELVEGSYAKIEPSSQKSWTRALYALSSGQFRGWNGTGYVILTKGFGSDESSVIAGKFAICNHKNVEDPGANHSRGWHPSHCELCGLDTSVDSGD